jgi:hypothetical protein
VGPGSLLVGIAGHNGIVDARPISALGLDALDLALAQLSDEDIQLIRAMTIARPPFISDYNLYLYGNGNPLSRIDPDGLFPVDTSCGGISDFCKRLGKNWRMIVFYILCSISDRRPPPPPPRPPRPPSENPAPSKPPATPPKK